jgi:hypothetical protein
MVGLAAEMLAVIPARVTPDAVSRWLEELAFDGLLTARAFAC